MGLWLWGMGAGLRMTSKTLAWDALEARQKFRSYLHALGTDPENDPPVFGFGVAPSIDVDSSLIASVKALYEMSAFHHVKDHTPYPAVLLTTGINDPRSDPWMLGKTTARLQAATSSGKPVLLRVDYGGGTVSVAAKRNFKRARQTRGVFCCGSSACPSFSRKNSEVASAVRARDGKGESAADGSSSSVTHDAARHCLVKPA